MQKYVRLIRLAAMSSIATVLMITACQSGIPIKTAGPKQSPSPEIQVTATDLSIFTPTPIPKPSSTSKPTEESAPAELAIQREILGYGKVEWAQTDSALIVNTDNGPQVFDPANLELLQHFETSHTQSELLSVHPDGGRVVAVNGTEIHLWNLDSGEVLAEVGPFLFGHFLMEFVDTGNLYVGTVYGGDSAAIYPLTPDLESASTGVSLNLADLEVDFEEPVAVSPRGDQIAVRKNGIEIYGPGDMNLVTRIDAFPTEMAFSRTGDQLIALEGDCVGGIYSVQSASKIGSFEWCTEPNETFGRVFGLELDPSNHLFAASDANGLLRIWELDTAEQVMTVEIPVRALNSLSFSRDGTKLASIGEDGLLQIWNISR